MTLGLSKTTSFSETTSNLKKKNVLGKIESVQFKVVWPQDSLLPSSAASLGTREATWLEETKTLGLQCGPAGGISGHLLSWKKDRGVEAEVLLRIGVWGCVCSGKGAQEK